MEQGDEGIPEGLNLKWVRDRSQRFGQRPHFDPAELDLECEKLIADFLKSRHGSVAFPIDTDDLVALLEARTADLDVYADLQEEGANVEGMTLFFSDDLPTVRISRELSEDGHRSNRFRTTLTHELGHVHFHACLFGLPQTGDLFPAQATSTPPRPVCHRDTILDARPQDWMEWQAGYACGAILMPITAVARLTRSKPAASPPVKNSPAATNLIMEVARAFGVSREAAELRLVKLNHLAVTPEAGIVEPLL